MNKYKILFDYGSYEGMNFYEEKNFNTIDEAVKFAVSLGYSTTFLIVQVVWNPKEPAGVIALENYTIPENASVSTPKESQPLEPSEQVIWDERKEPTHDQINQIIANGIQSAKGDARCQSPLQYASYVNGALIEARLTVVRNKYETCYAQNSYLEGQLNHLQAQNRKFKEALKEIVRYGLTPLCTGVPDTYPYDVAKKALEEDKK